MAKTEVNWTDYFRQTMSVMRTDGLLLVSSGKDGPNVMTIGWGSMGSIWGRPMFLVMVRPSRFTHGCLERNGDFTVNVPPASLSEVVAYCGMVSGRDRDKFKEKHLTPVRSKRVRSPIIRECVVHYECQTVHKNMVVPDALTGEIRSASYPAGDFHDIYFGEILAVYAESNARDLL